jgi:prevent-host-death family protein
MAVRLSATEVARNFSDVLNRVAAGEEVEITRSGAPVAVLAPARARFLTPERFREVLATAPPVDDRFVADLAEIRASVGPPEERWRS